MHKAGEISVRYAKTHEEFGLRHREVKVPTQNAQRHDMARSSSPTYSPVQVCEMGDMDPLHFVLSQSNTPFILQIPKLFTFPHLALGRENIANTAGDAGNIKVL